MKRLAIFTAVFVAASAFGASLVLQPGSAGKDSMLALPYPTNNYGSATRLMINWGANRTVRAIVEFPGLSAIPANSTINSAKLELWKMYTNNPNDTFGIYRVTATWAEMTVNWTNQPAHNSTAYATTLVLGVKWVAWDVKTLIQDWVNATYSNYGFKLIRRNEAGGAWPYFVSSDYGTATNRPKLTVDYTPTAIAPASVGKVKALFK